MRNHIANVASPKIAKPRKLSAVGQDDSSAAGGVDSSRSGAAKAAGELPVAGTVG
jgi:hypothetical protein